MNDCSFGKPTLFYFMEEGQLSRVINEDLRIERVYQMFGIAVSEDAQRPGIVELEYVSQEALGILFNKNNGEIFMIQRYVEGPGDHSSMLKTDWSTQFSLFSSLTNSNPISKHRLSLKQRYDTFEVGSTHLTETPLKPDITKNAIESACKSVAAHLQQTCPGHIKLNSMTLFLKCDGANDLWVLFWKSLNLVNFQKALIAKKPLRNRSLGLAAVLEGASATAVDKKFVRGVGAKQAESLRLQHNRKGAFFANDLGVRIREREMVFEPETFYRSMKLTNQKNQSFSWPKSLPYCRLCLEVKQCVCQLPFRFLKRSLVFEPDQRRLSMHRSDEIVYQFLRSLKSADHAAAGYVTRLRELEQEDCRVVKNQEEIDNNIPQLLRWLLGPKSFDELWQMFSNDTFLEFKDSTNLKTDLSQQRAARSLPQHKLHFRRDSPAEVSGLQQPLHSKSETEGRKGYRPTSNQRKPRAPMMEDPLQHQGSGLSTTMLDDAIILPELEQEVNKVLLKQKPTQDQKLVRKYLIQDIYKIKRKPEELTLLLNSQSRHQLDPGRHQPTPVPQHHSFVQNTKPADKPFLRAELSKSANSTRPDTRKEAELTIDPLDRPNRLRLHTADATHPKKRQSSATRAEDTLQRAKSVGLGKKLARLYENEWSRPVTSKWAHSNSAKEFSSKFEQLEHSATYGSQVLHVVKELRAFSELMQ